MDKTYKVLFDNGNVVIVNQFHIDLMLKGEPFPPESKLKFINLDSVALIIEDDGTAKRIEKLSI